MTNSGATQRLADELAERLIGCETAEETLTRIEHYLSTMLNVPAETRIALALAAIKKWRTTPRSYGHPCPVCGHD